MKNEYYLVKYTPYWATQEGLSGPDYPHGPNYRQDWEQLQVRGFVKWDDDEEVIISDFSILERKPPVPAHAEKTTVSGKRAASWKISQARDLWRQFYHQGFRRISKEELDKCTDEGIIDRVKSKQKETTLD